MESGSNKRNVQDLEVSYSAPAVPAVQQNLIPEKDDTFVKFGNFGPIKKLFSPVYSTLRLSRVSRVTVKRFLSNKLCPTRTDYPCNITIETDEDDLIGGFRLVNSATVNCRIIEALERETSCSLTKSTSLLTILCSKYP